MITEKMLTHRISHRINNVMKISPYIEEDIDPLNHRTPSEILHTLFVKIGCSVVAPPDEKDFAIKYAVNLINDRVYGDIASEVVKLRAIIMNEMYLSSDSKINSQIEAILDMLKIFDNK